MTLIPFRLAVAGSRSFVMHSVTSDFRYQSVDRRCSFNAIDLNQYEIILRLRFLFDSRGLICLNSIPVVVGAAAATSPVVAGDVA